MDSRNNNNNILFNTANTENSNYPSKFFQNERIFENNNSVFQPVPGLEGQKYQPYTNQYQHQSGDVQQTNQPIPTVSSQEWRTLFLLRPKVFTPTF